MNTIKSVLIKIGLFLRLITITREKRVIHYKTFETMDDFCKEMFR